MNFTPGQLREWAARMDAHNAGLPHDDRLFAHRIDQLRAHALIRGYIQSLPSRQGGGK